MDPPRCYKHLKNIQSMIRQIKRYFSPSSSSNSGDEVTIGFQLKLPEILSLSQKDYVHLHARWQQAIEQLPYNTILHKQDYFLSHLWESGEQKPTCKSFLAKGSDEHFKDTKMLKHTCYLFITHQNVKSNQDTINQNTFSKAVEAFSLVLMGSKNNYLGLSKLDRKQFPIEINALISNYPDKAFTSKALHTSTINILSFKTNDYLTKRIPSWTLWKDTNLPMSITAPIAVLLPCNHVYNQYYIIPDPKELSIYLRKSFLNPFWKFWSQKAKVLREKKEEVYFYNLENYQVIHTHCNVMIWNDCPELLDEFTNEVASSIEKINFNAVNSHPDKINLFYASLPGQASLLDKKHTFLALTEQAVHLMNIETGYQESYFSNSKSNMRFNDRLWGHPVTVDLSDGPSWRNIIGNKNKLVIGGDTGGTDMLLCHIVRSYYEQGTEIMVIDAQGDQSKSYQTLTKHLKGKFVELNEEQLPGFNPFRIRSRIDNQLLEHKKIDFETEELIFSLSSLLMSIWKPDREGYRNESVFLENSLFAYFHQECIEDRSPKLASFNDYINFVRDRYSKKQNNKLTCSSCGSNPSEGIIESFLTASKPYCAGGKYHWLLNAPENPSYSKEPLLVFGLHSIKHDAELYHLYTLLLLNTYNIRCQKRNDDGRKMMIINGAWERMNQPSLNFLSFSLKQSRYYHGEILLASTDIPGILLTKELKEVIGLCSTQLALDMKMYRNRSSEMMDVLGMNEHECDQLFSLNALSQGDSGLFYQEVFINQWGIISVLGLAISAEEYITYTANEHILKAIQWYTNELGNLEGAIAFLAQALKQGHLDSLLTIPTLLTNQ